MNFNVKRGNTGRPLRMQILSRSNGRPITNLSGSTVNFSMSRIGDSGLTQVIDSAATIEDESEAIIRYNWTEEDVSTEGDFLAEFTVTYADSSVETFPNGGFINVRISTALGT